MIRRSCGAWLAVALLALACGGPSREEPPAPLAAAPPAAGPQVYRGQFVWGHEARSFTPCGEERDWWVVDATPDGELRQVYEELASQPYQAIFAEVAGETGPAPTEGFGADYDGQLTVRELRRAVLEGPGCGEDISAFAFRALGNEPFWGAVIRDSTIVFTQPGDPPRLEFPAVAPEVEADGMSWSSATETPAAEIRIELRKARCVDSMSGARFPYRATVVLDGRELTGCGYAGGAANPE